MGHPRDRRRRLDVLVVGLLLALLAAAAGCDDPSGASPDRPASVAPSEDGLPSDEGSTGSDPTGEGPSRGGKDASRDDPRGRVTLAFGGDVHFEAHVAALLQRPQQGLGRINEVLSGADLAMVNLETAITTRGTAEPKLYTFRTSARALDLLAASGVDVVTMANNHAADYGSVGLEDTLEVIRDHPMPVVGVGRDSAQAFRPHRVSIGGTDLAVLGAVTTREYTTRNWAAGDGEPGVASATTPKPRRLLEAVRAAKARDHVVVVYLHWGHELDTCPTPRQRSYARQLSRAGADIIVGSHAHVLQGSGWLGDTYVNYGLGNFVWYHGYRPQTGVLTLTLRNGEVTGDSFAPALTQGDGTPGPLAGSAQAAAVEAWEGLRGCANLAPAPPGPGSS
ncbi:MAG: CapA protein [uncultured Nocardioidaceae bacterium]|uniref:CapA protein n=1 Tax=uncultured Nocardioidaceae bacterium TaxID=253824 RepID=A0A6J4LQA0_9ACTN|nr:MAG: CapA protein [uncultured Nocardioidaceae bacterium]